MIELNSLGKYRKGRIWFSEIPYRNQAKDVVSKKIIVIKKPKCDKSAKVALELYYPRNSSYYGMLGVEYTPDNSRELTIEVFFIKKGEERFNESIASEYDEIFMGISREYCDAILSTVEKKVIESSYGFSGTLRFDFGAFSSIGSSSAIFTRLSELLIGILELSTHKKEIIEKYVSENM